MTSARRCSILVLLSAIALAGSSCPGGTGSTPPQTAALDVQVLGLPSNADASVTVSSGAVSQLVTSSRTLGLGPGDYTVSAEPVLTGQFVMGPTAPGQTVSIAPGQTATVTVSYNTLRALALRLVEVIGNGLDQPIFLASPPGDATRIFIAERPGRIRVYQNGSLVAPPFLDVSASVSTDGERGLLSFAFHPQYAQNGFVFVHFTDTNGDIAVERFTRSGPMSSNVADLASRTPIIKIPHPTFSNHNGGAIAFGADGLLYLSTGDGGGGGDPLRNAQDPTRLLGKMLRIDVSGAAYSIPPTNPFGNEVWALGLRNPWRWAFDEPANLIYLADVGQNRFEEVDVALADAGGVNYGWAVTEGNACFPSDPCDKGGHTLPVLEYDHSAGCSITGGYVYRGSAIADLQGRYFYSDFCSGFVRSFRLVVGQATERVDWNVPSVGNVLSFGEDANRELYVITGTSKVYRIAQQ
jgi:glucose/arabinose dehydrogenase